MRLVTSIGRSSTNLRGTNARYAAEPLNRGLSRPPIHGRTTEWIPSAPMTMSKDCFVPSENRTADDESPGSTPQREWRTSGSHLTVAPPHFQVFQLVHFVQRLPTAVDVATQNCRQGLPCEEWSHLPSGEIQLVADAPQFLNMPGQDLTNVKVEKHLG